MLSEIRNQDLDRLQEKRKKIPLPQTTQGRHKIVLFTMMMVCPIEPCEILPIIQLSELVEVAANYFISGADQKINRERETRVKNQ